MRNLAELGMYQYRSHTYPAPSDALISKFEQEFQVKLPEDYIRFLKHSNGGSTEICSFDYVVTSDIVTTSDVDTFFALTEEKDNHYLVWNYTRLLGEILGRKAIALARNGGDDVLYLQYEGDTHPSVHMLFRASDNATPQVASSFGEFIDKLYLAPEEE